MYIVKTKKAEPFEADMVAKGAQFPVLHIYTHNITPINAYEIFGDEENCELITADEYVYYAFIGDAFEDDVEYYEYDPVIGYYLTADADKDPNKNYFLKEFIGTKSFTGYIEIFAVQKSTINDIPNEILIWLQRPMNTQE